MAAPAERAASSARRSSSTLAPLATVSGSTSTPLGRGASRRVSATSRTPPPPDRAAAAAASAAARRPSSDRSAVWAKPVVSPTTTRMPAPRSRPEDSSSTRPSSSMADDERLSSTNTSAKSPPVRRAAASVRWIVASSSTATSRSVDGRDGGGERLGRGRAGIPRFSPAGRVSPYCTRVPLQLGLAARVVLDVHHDDTAGAMHTGEVPVLSPPRLVALCEQASLQAVRGQVPEGRTTVGMRVQLDHLAPTAVGSKVTAEARLDKIEGRRLIFAVSASDERGLVAAGKITRVVVDVEAFMEKCS